MIKKAVSLAVAGFILATGLTPHVHAQTYSKSHASALLLPGGGTDPINTLTLQLSSNSAGGITWTLPASNGTPGYVLSNNAGTLSWVAQSGGMTNPMTTIGDMIYASATGTPATPARLGVGTNGQLLTIASGLPAWTTATYPAATTANNLVYSSATNTVANLATANNGVLATNSSGVPSITTTPTLGVAGTTAGTLTLASGIAAFATTIQTSATTPTATYTYQFPTQTTTTPTSGQVLTAGTATGISPNFTIPLSWQTPSGGGSNVLYNQLTTSPQNIAAFGNNLFDVEYASSNGNHSYPGAVIKSVGAGNANSATGLSITAATAGNGPATGLVLSVTGGTTNMDISGTSGNWSMTSAGNLTTTGTLSATASGAQTTASTEATISNTSTSSTASIAKTGLSISSTGTWNGTTATNTGLALTVTGGTSNTDILGTGSNWAITSAGSIALGGISAPNVALDLKTDWATRAESVTLANGVNNNVTPTTATSNIRVSGPSAAFSISGFAGGYDGKRLHLYNPTGQTMTISNESTNSSSGNRINTLASNDIVLAGNGSTDFIYDASASPAEWVMQPAMANTITGLAAVGISYVIRASNSTSYATQTSTGVNGNVGLDPTLQFTAGPNETYSIDGTVLFVTTGSGSGTTIDFGVQVPGSGAVCTVPFECFQFGGTFKLIGAYCTNVPGDGVDPSFGNAAENFNTGSITGSITYHGILTTGTTGGTVGLLFQLVSGSGSPSLTVESSSFLNATRVK